MICPNCNTNNLTGNQYCMNCGKELPIGGDETMARYTPPGRALYFITGQTIITVIVLYLLRSVLLGLKFIQDLHIAGWKITTAEIISTIMYILIIGLLVIFARALSYFWPQAFPLYKGIGVVLTTIVYVIGLSVIYSMAKPLFLRFILDSEPLLILCVLLALVAIFLLGRAAVVIYQSLPAWLDNLRTSLLAPLPKSIEKPE